MSQKLNPKLNLRMRMGMKSPTWLWDLCLKENKLSSRIQIPLALTPPKRDRISLTMAGMPKIRESNVLTSLWADIYRTSFSTNLGKIPRSLHSIMKENLTFSMWSDRIYQSNNHQENRTRIFHQFPGSLKSYPRIRLKKNSP